MWYLGDGIFSAARLTAGGSLVGGIGGGVLTGGSAVGCMFATNGGPPVYALYGGGVLLFVLGGNSVLSIREAARLRPHDDSEVVADQNGTSASASSPKRLFQFQKIIPDEVVTSHDRNNDVVANGAGW